MLFRSVPKLVSEMVDSGTDAITLVDADAIVAHLTHEMCEGDVVAVMSNGGFGGIHDKLLNILKN